MMKKILITIILYICAVQTSFSQKRTIIEGTIENFQDTIINLLLIDGMFATRTSQEYSVKTEKGSFKFSFLLTKTSTATLYVNNDLAFVPGAFSVVVNPGDSLNFTISGIKKMGLINMEIGGIGSEKILTFQKVLKKMNSHRLFSKPFSKQTITERYLEADRELDIIESEFLNFAKPLSKNNLLVKAQLTDQALDMILINSVQNQSDSTLILFKKFIIDKKRIEPLLNNVSIEYFGGFRLIPNYLNVYNRFVGGKTQDRFADPATYNKLVSEKFSNHHGVRDYLLSDLAIQIFQKHWDNDVSKNMYKFYEGNTSKQNPHYQKVKEEYEHVVNNLKPGKPFYSFSLPDTTGNIHRLKDFKGKVVVLDFWFTGCSGCKAITPALAKSEEEMKNEAVQFISINVDKLTIWKQGIGKYSSKSSIQLYTDDQRFDHPIISFAKVNAYPRLIVIDKDGNLAGVPPNPLNDPEGFKSYIKKYL